MPDYGINYQNKPQSNVEVFEKLTKDEKLVLKQFLEKELKDSEANEDGPSELMKNLLNGPVMSDEQYLEFLEMRKSFNEWPKNLFA